MPTMLALYLFCPQQEKREQMTAQAAVHHALDEPAVPTKPDERVTACVRMTHYTMMQ